MEDEIVIDPRYVFNRSLWMSMDHGYNPFLIFPLFFKKIYTDKELLLDIVENFDYSHYTVLENLFEFKVFMNLPLGETLRTNAADITKNGDPPFTDSMFSIYIARELHKAGIVFESFDWLPLETSYAYYMYSFKNDFRYVGTHEMNSYLLTILNAEDRVDELVRVKKTMKILDAALFLIDQIVTDFEVDADHESQYYKMIENNELFQQYLDDFASRAGGYELKQREKKYLSSEMAKARKAIAAMDREVKIASKAGKKAVAISSMLFPIPVISQGLNLVGDEIVDFLIKVMRSMRLRIAGLAGMSILMD